MLIYDLVKLTNKYLAGEQLVYEKLEPFYDEVIDDINNQLSSTFPAFSQLGITSSNATSKKYDFFPDAYVRSCLAIGAAHKFYIMDEEGVDEAKDLGYAYNKNLFYMVRDYIDQVPLVFQSDTSGGLRINENLPVYRRIPFHFDIWS